MKIGKKAHVQGWDGRLDKGLGELCPNPQKRPERKEKGRPHGGSKQIVAVPRDVEGIPRESPKLRGCG